MNQILRCDWLPEQARWSYLACLGLRTVSRKKCPRKPHNKSFIDQACSVKMAGYWPGSFFASLWTLTPSRSINTQKKNLANIQPSWPHTWSITHMCFLLIPSFAMISRQLVLNPRAHFPIPYGVTFLIPIINSHLLGHINKWNAWGIQYL